MCQSSKWHFNADFHKLTSGFRRDACLKARLLACCEASTGYNLPTFRCAFSVKSCVFKIKGPTGRPEMSVNFNHMRPRNSP